MNLEEPVMLTCQESQYGDFSYYHPTIKLPP